MDGAWQTKRQVLTMLKSVDPNEVGRGAPAGPLAPVGRRLPHALLERALGGRLSLPVRLRALLEKSKGQGETGGAHAFSKANFYTTLQATKQAGDYAP